MIDGRAIFKVYQINKYLFLTTKKVDKQNAFKNVFHA